MFVYLKKRLKVSLTVNIKKYFLIYIYPNTSIRKYHSKAPSAAIMVRSSLCEITVPFQKFSICYKKTTNI